MDELSPVISKEWIALILLPAVGSLAGEYLSFSTPYSQPSFKIILECITAVNVSVKDKLSLSVSVAVGSTIASLIFTDETYYDTNILPFLSSKLLFSSFRMSAFLLP